MHKLFVIIICILLSSTIEAKQLGYDPLIMGSGKLIHVTKQLPKIKSVTINNAADLYIQQASNQGTNELLIDADDNIVPLLIPQVSAGHLELNSKYRSLQPTVRPKFTLKINHLNIITANGDSRIICSTGINQDMLTINMSNRASANIWFNGDKITINLRNNAELIIGGYASIQNINIHGDSHFDGTALRGSNSNTSENK